METDLIYNLYCILLIIIASPVSHKGNKNKILYYKTLKNNA